MDKKDLKALDTEVAERVMGWRTGTISQNVWYSETEHDSFHKESFRPSKSVEIAMRVVEKMLAQGWSFACTLYEGKLPYASFCKRTAASSRHAEAESLPEAICRAALAAIGVEK